MSFDGFPEETVAFLAGLAMHNDRVWFTAHKSDYKTHVEAPAKAFLESMSGILSDLVGQELGGKVFRIHRDVRFSKDKTPYNTHVRMAFFPNVVSKGSCGLKPSFFFSLEPDKVIAGAGSMDFPNEVLEAYRAAVDAEKTGASLATLLKKYPEKDGFRMDDPALKRVPKGFDPEHPRASLLRRKSLAIWHEEALPDVLHTKKAVNHLLGRYKKLKPLYDWLDTL